MKPVDVKPSTYIDFSKEINNKDPKFKIVGIVRISKYENIFAKGHVPNWSEEVFVITKVKNTVPWTYVEKVIKRKGHKPYVKWKGYDSSFNSWIDQKDIT